MLVNSNQFAAVRQDIANNERIPIDRFFAVGLFEIFAAPAAIIVTKQ